MNEIFNRVYKETSDDDTKGQYSMMTFDISLNVNEDDEEYQAVFLHEYTHYLQTMTTISGFIEFEKIMGTFLRLFSHTGANQDKIMLPLKECDFITKTMGNQSLINLNDSFFGGLKYEESKKSFIFEEDREANDFNFSETKFFDKFENKEKNVLSIIYNWQKVPIVPLVVKENMANVVSLIFSYDKTTLSDGEMAVVFSVTSLEYNIILRYLYCRFPSGNHLALTYLICEILLNTKDIYGRVEKVFNYIEKNYVELGKKGTRGIIESIKEHIGYEQEVENDINEIKDIINQREEMFSKLKEENEFFNFIILFYKYIEEGIGLRKENDTFFTKMIKETKTFVEDIALKIGSPFIFKKDDKKTNVLTCVDSSFKDALAYVNTSHNLAYDLWESKSFTECPIFDPCDASEKNENCKNKYLKNYLDVDFPNCWIQDALRIAGINEEIIERSFGDLG